MVSNNGNSTVTRSTRSSNLIIIIIFFLSPKPLLYTITAYCLVGIGVPYKALEWFLLGFVEDKLSYTN